MKQRNSPSVSEMGDRVYFMTVAACLETGLSLDIMAEGVAVPVLGVCLGMQALAHAVGASVVRAPEPVHGRLSNIRHDGHPLFRGIPSGAYLWWCPAALHQLGVPGWRRGKLLSRSFYVLAGPTGRYSVVRYHSLVVDETTLPTSLPAIAWTCGGHQAVRPALGDRGVGAQPSALQGNGDVVMAVAHSQLPLYGVQFHPESVATAFGHALMANFRDLTAAHRGLATPTCNPLPANGGYTPNLPEGSLHVLHSRCDHFNAVRDPAQGIFCWRHLHTQTANQTFTWSGRACQGCCK